MFIHAAAPDIVIILVKLCRFAVALLVASLAWPASKAELLYEQGEKAERAHDPARAYVFYLQAAAADPGNLKYWSRAEALRPVAGLLDVSQAKRGEDLLPDKLDQTVFGRISAEDLEEARKPLPPSKLKATPGKRDYDLRGDSKALWEQVGAALHLDVAFDPQYQPTKPLHFELSAADYRVALRALEAATDSFISPISDQLIFIANDTTQKRTEFERTATVVVPFPEGETVQELQEIATSVRGVLDMQRVMVDNALKAILMRDRVTKIRLAQKLLHDLLRPRAQVSIDVDLITTDLSSSLSYGISPQTAFPLVNFPNKKNLLNSIPAGYNAFLTFGGGASLIGLGITSAQLFANVAKGNSSTVLDSQLIALDGQASSMHIGQRYPIITNSYIGGAASSLSGTGGTTTPGVPGTGTGAGSLVLSQTSLSWTYSSGGAAPTATDITVNSTAGAINYTGSVQSSSAWLVINNQSNVAGTLPATLSVTPGPALAGLAAGSYAATIAVVGSDGSAAQVTVNLTVNGGAQGFSLSPATVALTSTAGGLEVQQVVTVTSTSSAALSATVTGTGVSVTLSGTTVAPGTPATVTVLGNPAGLGAQDYFGVLTVTVGGVIQEIPVSFKVISNSSLVLSQSSVAWTYSTGGSLPAATTVTISSSTAATRFTATASSANQWLLVNGQTSVTGALPSTLTISPGSSLAELATGNYTGTVQLQAPDGSIAYFNVNLSVNGGTATGLTVSPNPITLNASVALVAAQQTITVTSATAGTFSASVSGSGLSITNTNTTIAANTPITLTLNGNPTNLAAQNYIGYLTITAAGVTQTVEVTFSVGAVNSGTNGTGVYTPPPTFNFEDLGLVLKITPHVHGADDVTLDVSAEFKLLGSTSVDGVPVISDKKYESQVHVLQGQWAVLAGLMTATEAKTITGLPILSIFPFLRNNTVMQDTGQTLIVLKPHITILPPTEEPTFGSWAGTETKLPTDL